MKISTRSRYGLRAMLQLALQYGKGPVMMQSIAQNQGVSRKYLDTIFILLKNAGLIQSRRGIGGGHVLARPPDQIRVGDIMRAIEPLDMVDCLRLPSYCARTHRCVTREVWHAATQAVEKVLDGFTLADLVRKHDEKHGWAKSAEDDADAEEPPDEERCLIPDEEQCLLE